MKISRPLPSMRQQPRRQPVRNARSPWGWLGVGAMLGLMCSLLAFAPAHWLAAALDRATDGRVQLRETRGTVWNGSALLTLSGGAGSMDRSALPGRISWLWGLHPGDLASMAAWSPGLSVHMPCCADRLLDLRVQAGLASAQVHLARAEVRLPAALLAGLGTPFNTLQLGGTLVLSTPGLRLEWLQGRLRVQGEADLTVTNAESSLSTLKPLGTYRLQMSGGDTPRLALSTLDGALRLQGEGQIVGARLRFDGVASAAPNFEDALSNLLNIIGRRDGARSIISVS